MTSSTIPGYVWDQAIDDLRSWHVEGSASAARAALVFVEGELRLAIPPLVRRSWPPELVEDAVREFLSRLLEKRLPEGIADPGRYIIRAFRNRCIDRHRARQRRREVGGLGDAGWELPAPDESQERKLQRAELAQQMAGALDTLSVADRVALKLVDAPEWLDDGEIAWLGQRAGLTPDQTRDSVRLARDVFALTELYDPKPVGGGTEDRRLRMERFRRRRGRAREKLRMAFERLGGGGDVP